MSVKTPICILGYDALEIELVEKFDLPNLKQKEYGKTDISDFNTISTQILWSSFLTGENTESDFTDKEGSETLRKLVTTPFFFLKSHVSTSFAETVRSFTEDTFVLNGVKGNILDLDVVEDLNKKTLFDLVKDSIGINIPTYNQSRKAGNLKEKFLGEISDAEFQKGVWEVFEETKEKLLENLEKELVMAWFGPVDTLGHVYRSDTEKMREVYRALDEFAGKVRKKFKGQVFIIADHGMERLGKFGDHSKLNYGYYSSNRELELTNPKITSFYHIIKDILEEKYDSEKYEKGQVEERKEEKFKGDEKEEIKKRLRDLGYFD